MSSSAFLRRRSEAEAAISAVLAGALAKDLETETVDFKEELGSVDPRTKSRRSIDPHDERASAAIATEAACMANSPGGGTLIVGVADELAGPAAFVGAHLDVTWLRQRIWALTTPHLSLDEFEERTVAGARIYLMDIAHNLGEIYVDQKLRVRFGDRCIEPTPSQARDLLERRRGFDWSAEPSGLRYEDAIPEALSSARRHYSEAHDEVPDSDLEIARRMGVLLDPAAANPELNRAGALLLAPFEPSIEQVVLLQTPAEGVPSRRDVRGSAPLLPLFDAAISLLRDHAFPATPEIVGVQRRAIRAIPEGAFREALVNAVMHRDYQLGHLTVNGWVIGDPATVFKVRSPGGFPPGVVPDRLLSSPSRPRNRALTQALRVLGIAEAEGIGIATMFRLMLRDGHAEPSVLEDGGDVVVVLSGGSPDRPTRAFFDALAGRDPGIEHEVQAAIAITQLLSAPVLRPERLGRAAQTTPVQAMRMLERLAADDVLDRLLDGSRSFRLSEAARNTLAPRIAYRTRAAAEKQWEEIEALLDTGEEISSVDVRALLRVSQPRAARIIRTLIADGRLSPAGGRVHGRGVRYRRGPAAAP